MEPFIPDQTSLAGFQRLQRLGEGSEGEVWLARDEVLQRLVTLKRLRHEGVHRDHTSQRRSLIACAGLTHPSIARVYGVIAQDNALWIVSEYIAGMPISEPSLFSATMSTQVILDIAEALSGIHAAAVVHGDIAPGNIVIDVSGRARLLDFGIARIVGDAATGAGTSGFIAPEVSAGTPVVLEHDTYSLGVTVFWLLCGQVPEYMTDSAGKSLQMLPEQPEDLPWPADTLWQMATALVAELPGERPAMTELTVVLRELIRGFPGNTREQLQGLVADRTTLATDARGMQSLVEKRVVSPKGTSKVKGQMCPPSMTDDARWVNSAIWVWQAIPRYFRSQKYKWWPHYWLLLMLLITFVVAGMTLNKQPPPVIKLLQSRMDIQPGAKPSAHLTPFWLDEVIQQAVTLRWLLDENTATEQLEVTVRCRGAWCQLMMEHRVPKDVHWHQTTLPVTSAPALWQGALTDLVSTAAAE